MKSGRNLKVAEKKALAEAHPSLDPNDWLTISIKFPSKGMTAMVIRHKTEDKSLTVEFGGR